MKDILKEFDERFEKSSNMKKEKFKFNIGESAVYNDVSSQKIRVSVIKEIYLYHEEWIYVLENGQSVMERDIIEGDRKVEIELNGMKAGDLVGFKDYDYSHEDIRYCYHTIVFLGLDGQVVLKDYDNRLMVCDINDLELKK